VDAQAKFNADQYRARKEAEIISEAEAKLEVFSTEYFETCQLAMMKTIDVTIQQEEETLLHKHRAQLLPLASSIPTTALGAAHKALDEGLAASAPSQPTQRTPQSTPLPGEDRLDAIIAQLSKSVLAKLIPFKYAT